MSVPLWPNGPTWAELSPEAREWVKGWTLAQWLAVTTGAVPGPLPPSNLERKR